MCSRYRLTSDVGKLRTVFPDSPDDWFDSIDRKYESFYPGSSVPVILNVRDSEYFGHFQWGIVPDWAKNKSMTLINTKSEEALVKPTWKGSFRKRRCLMPATSFFEPAAIDGKKYQVEFTMKDGSAFAFAGIWQKTDKFGEPRNCCSLLTCESNSIVGEVHGRMPVILHRAQFETYLNTPAEQAEKLMTILLPYPAEEMDAEHHTGSRR